MDMYGVGRVTPGYEINDNPATGGRSIGYGCCPEVRYSSDFTSWVQEDPGSLKLQPLPPTSRATPDFTEGRKLGYGADLPASITQYYPGFLKKQVSLPVVGTMMLGTLAIGIIATLLVIKYVRD